MELRKIAASVEYVHREGERVVEPVIRTCIVAAVLTNPWAGRGHVEDLTPEIEKVAPQLANVLVPELRDQMGGASGIEAFGKAAVVGLAGEVEHASALIHTLRFGNVFRQMAEGDSYLSSTNKMGPAACTISVPMIHKNDRSRRSHFLTTDFVILDAPRDNEIVVAIGAASGGRPFARIGDRHQDIAAGVGVQNS